MIIQHYPTRPEEGILVFDIRDNKASLVGRVEIDTVTAYATIRSRFDSHIVSFHLPTDAPTMELTTDVHTSVSGQDVDVQFNHEYRLDLSIEDDKLIAVRYYRNEELLASEYVTFDSMISK